MTEEEEIQMADALRDMVHTSPGYKYLNHYINSAIKDGWERFIEMPVEKKTSKMAYKYQSEYRVLKDLLSWIDDSIRTGEQIDLMQKKEKLVQHE